MILKGVGKMSIYGYARISTKKQSIERQIKNIMAEYPTAIIYQEAYTGTKADRPEFTKLTKVVGANDTIVFDSVSRMSRNADDGIKLYFELFDKGVNLIFLKEHYIDTSVYAESLKDKIELQGTDEDEIFIGLNNYFRKLAKKQIKIAFDQAEKEVKDLHERTSEGLKVAGATNRINADGTKEKGTGTIALSKVGKKLTTKKSVTAKEKIRKLSKDFNGTNTDVEVMQILGIARNTYYKYKAELKAE